MTCRNRPTERSTPSSPSSTACPTAAATGAIYARYSSRYQHSIADQVRGCLQAATQQGIFVPREYVFFDLAVRGAKQPAPRSLQFVEEEVAGRGIRCLFVRSGVDTADEKRWRLLLNHYASIDEFVPSLYSENIRVAHEGLFRQKLVFGTIPFGYRARPVAGR